MLARVLLILSAISFPMHSLSESLRAGIFLGVNEGLFTEDPLFYAEDDARKMYMTFLEYGNMERELSFLIQGSGIKDVQKAFQELEERISLARKIKSISLEFIFFYSGHAGTDGLHIAGNTLYYRDLYNMLQSLKAQFLIVILDACNSGKFLSVKGVKFIKEEFRVRAFDYKEGEVFITSSAENEFSQERDEFRGAVFTYFLANGLLGEADVNKDGMVSLSEAYNFAAEKTVIETFGSGKGFQSPSYKYNLIGKSDIVLTRIINDKQLVTISEEKAGILTFMDKDKGIILGDFNIGSSGRKLSIPRGNYKVRYKTNDGHLYIADLYVSGDGYFKWSEFKKISERTDPLKGTRRLHTIHISLMGGVEKSNENIVVPNTAYGAVLRFDIDNIFMSPLFMGLSIGIMKGSYNITVIQTELNHASLMLTLSYIIGIKKQISRVFEISGNMHMGIRYVSLKDSTYLFKTKETRFLFISGVSIDSVFNISRDVGFVFPEISFSVFGYKRGGNTALYICPGIYGGVTFNL